jgi:hypothetical protein
MPAQTTNLFLLEDLEDVGRTSELAESDLDALHAVADWIKTYVVKPHKDLGRAGPVCPFVPVSLEGTKAKPGFWTRRRPFAQVRHGSNIQLLSYSLVRHFGLLQSRSPTGTCQMLSSL